MLTQLPSIEWPSGDSKPVALLRCEPEKLSARLNFEFLEGVDDLDYVRTALLELGNGERVMLQQHLRAPREGIEVYADAAADASKVLAQLSEDLELDSHDLSWRREEV